MTASQKMPSGSYQEHPGLGQKIKRGFPKLHNSSNSTKGSLLPFLVRTKGPEKPSAFLTPLLLDGHDTHL